MASTRQCGEVHKNILAHKAESSNVQLPPKARRSTHGAKRRAADFSVNCSVNSLDDDYPPLSAKQPFADPPEWVLLFDGNQVLIVGTWEGVERLSRDCLRKSRSCIF